MRSLIATAATAVVGLTAAATLLGAASHSNMNDLAAPALLAGGLLAFALGSLGATRPKRRTRS